MCIPISDLGVSRKRLLSPAQAKQHMLQKAQKSIELRGFPIPHSAGAASLLAAVAGRGIYPSSGDVAAFLQPSLLLLQFRPRLTVAMAGFTREDSFVRDKVVLDDVDTDEEEPADYYAEIVKTDAHMHKIKRRLLSEKEKIEEAEERKKKWRKQRQQWGFAKGNDDGPELNFEGEEGFKQSKKKRPGVSPGDSSGGLAKKGKQGKNRKSRDSKFGYGGRKGLKKQNSAETTNDFRGFNQMDKSQNKRRKIG
uniref:Uncharacterized protein n=1 Tax=Leersia perrieri TaxID=77586 RepID=A0A0D9WYQ7_9ORYZ